MFVYEDLKYLYILGNFSNFRKFFLYKFQNYGINLLEIKLKKREENSYI